MIFSENEKTTYLFCAPLLQTKTKHLTIIEWNAVVKALAKANLEPTYLLDCSPSDLLNLLTEATKSQKISIIKKIESRQKLGFGILELEELFHSGYNILFRSNYPKRLKKLKLDQRPPFYYYIGNLSILSGGQALSIVGSREGNRDELHSVSLISSEAAQKGVVIISGGARGVDSTAVESTLQNGGQAIVFPSDGLMKWARKKEYRQYIQNGQVLVMSTQPIQAKFSGFYAMQRNKFIHSTGDATLVASSKISGDKKSGTWEGVTENIKAKWSPLYVLGQSEGVENLKEMNLASPFTSFENIFKPNTTEVMASLQNHFTELIAKAQELGLSDDSIKVAFKQSFKDRHNNFMSINEESLKSSIEVTRNNNPENGKIQMDLFNNKIL